MQVILSLLLGYMMGSVNPSFIIGKIKGVDIRNEGNGNPGASNTVVVLGTKWGILVAVLDILKAFTAVKLAGLLFPEFALAGALAGAASILGHMYPIWMGFRGGKGLACLVGSILGYDWLVFLLLVGGMALLALLLDYIVGLTLGTSVVFPVVYALQTGNAWGTAAFLLITIIMVWKHIINIKKIMAGTEIRLSVLWRRNEELDRVEQNKK